MLSIMKRNGIMKELVHNLEKVNAQHFAKVYDFGINEMDIG